MWVFPIIQASPLLTRFRWGRSNQDKVKPKSNYVSPSIRGTWRVQSTSFTVALASPFASFPPFFPLPVLYHGVNFPRQERKTGKNKTSQKEIENVNRGTWSQSCYLRGQMLSILIAFQISVTLSLLYKWTSSDCYNIDRSIEGILTRHAHIVSA